MDGLSSNDDEWFPQFLQFTDDTLFGLYIIASGNVADAAVSHQYDANGGVISNDLPGSYFGRFFEGHLVIKHREFLPCGVLHLLHTQGSAHGITNTVNQSDFHDQTALGADFYASLGTNLGSVVVMVLPARSGQFVFGSFSFINVFMLGKTINSINLFMKVDLPVLTGPTTPK
jgi:hypothetical protein